MLARATILITMFILCSAKLVYAEKSTIMLDSNIVKSTNSKTRIVFGSKNSDGSFYIGIQIEMTPEWKTYWRLPGNSGIAPNFDWSNSDNLEDAQILWPSPFWFKDAAGDNIGYREVIVFPVLVKPINKNNPILLKLRFFYGVCDKLCLPVEGEINYEIMAGFKKYNNFRGFDIVEYYRSFVPKKIEKPSILGIANVKLLNKAIEVEVISDSDNLNIFTEVINSSGSYTIGKPEYIADPDNPYYRYRINAKALAKDINLNTTKFRFTVSNGLKHIEQIWPAEEETKK